MTGTAESRHPKSLVRKIAAVIQNQSVCRLAPEDYDKILANLDDNDTYLTADTKLGVAVFSLAVVASGEPKLVVNIPNRSGPLLITLLRDPRCKSGWIGWKRPNPQKRHANLD